MSDNIPYKNSFEIKPIIRPFVRVSTNSPGVMSTLIETTADYFLMPPSTTGAITRGIMGGSNVWSVAHTDINAAADRWAGFIHYDSVGGLLWVIATDTTPTPDTHYLATIAASNGAIVQIANFQSDNFSLGGGTFMAPQRATETSGDFTCISLGRKFVLTSAGVLSTDEVWAPTGISDSVGNEASGLLDPNGVYVLTSPIPSASSSIQGITIDTCNSDAGNNDGISIPIPGIAGAGRLGIWGPYIAIMTAFVAAGTENHVIRYYDKADFFRYIDEYLGV
jgi:hypothetical protein